MQLKKENCFAMKWYDEMEVQLYEFLTSAPNGEIQARAFIPWERRPVLKK